MQKFMSKAEVDTLVGKKIELTDMEWITLSATIKYVLENLLDADGGKSQLANDLKIIREKIVNAKQK